MSELGQALIAEVRKIADEYPDIMYEPPKGYFGVDSCRYVYEGAPSCLIGQAAWTLGWIDPSFETEYENQGGVGDLNAALDLGINEDELEWLSYAQDAQDHGTPWGQVPNEADESVLVSA